MRFRIERAAVCVCVPLRAIAGKAGVGGARLGTGPPLGQSGFSYRAGSGAVGVVNLPMLPHTRAALAAAVVLAAALLFTAPLQLLLTVVLLTRRCVFFQMDSGIGNGLRNISSGASAPITGH